MRDAAPHPTVLILGGSARDQAAMREALSDDFDCLAAASAGAAWELMSEHFVQVAICAGDLDGNACLEVFDYLLDHWPETMLVLLSDGEATAGVRRPNIQQVLRTPWTDDELRAAVSTAARVFHLTRENERMTLEMRCLGGARPAQREPRRDVGFEEVICTSASPMTGVIASARQFASFDVPILLSGEPGTGKASLAAAIHANSLRSDQPFLTLNVAGLSEAAVELSLFGRRRPGNGQPPVNRPGLVRKADQGTFYIAGVEHLSAPIQLRLLKLLREGEFETDGGAEPETSRVRLIASTGPDPQKDIEDGRLDEALYYALSVGELALPPLRDRACDIPAIARSLVGDAGRIHGKVVYGISDAALGFLREYSWPGNLSELENEITRMLIQSQEAELGPEVISRHILQSRPARDDADEAQIMATNGHLKDRIEAIEARILRETLTRLRWNKSRSAAELGLSRVGLRAKLDRYGIAPPQTEEA